MSYTIWLTGLPGSGKTTIAEKLLERGAGRMQILDGDDFRESPLGEGLGFSPEGRMTNIKRAATVAAILNAHQVVVIAAFVTPTEEMRIEAGKILWPSDMVLVYVNTPQETCEARDPKGLYKAAREGALQDMTGVQSPFEAPKAPDVVVDGSDTTLAVDQIIDYLTQAAGTK